MTTSAAGVGLFVIAGAVDVAIHVAGGSPTWETPAHVATLLGMVTTLAGTVTSGVSQHRHNPPKNHPLHNKEISDAIR